MVHQYAQLGNITLKKNINQEETESAKKATKEEPKLLTPLRLLTRDTPGVGAQMLDNCVTTEGQKDDEDYAITLDYSILDV